MSVVSKLSSTKPTKNFWVYIVIGVLLMATSILLAPIWQNVEVPWKTWGGAVINLVIALFLSLYLIFFLVKKISKTHNRSLKLLTIVEFVLLLLIDLYLILGQWIPSINIFNVRGACAITGVALLIRGIVEVFRAYFYQSGSKTKYPIWWLCIAIAFVSVGTWMIVRPFIEDIVILWVFVVLIFLSALLFIYHGVVVKPKKK